MIKFTTDIESLTVLSSIKVNICTTDKDSRYVSAIKKFLLNWLYKTFGKRNIVERSFLPIKHTIMAPMGC